MERMRLVALAVSSLPIGLRPASIYSRLRVLRVLRGSKCLLWRICGRPLRRKSPIAFEMNDLRDQIVVIKLSLTLIFPSGPTHPGHVGRDEEGRTGVKGVKRRAKRGYP